jgi:CDP-glycerol glycerophosphotransferase (TagB/SpsB family)/glycosyltransferase involved in cell wall biosynthesis
VSLYLESCLASLLDQGFSDQELEVIMVNNASTDGSGLLAQKWAQNYKSFRLMTLKNKGLSEARNAGLKEATGEFMVFLDSDDIVPPGAYRKMVNILLKTGSDFVTGAPCRFNEAHKFVAFNRSIDLYSESRERINIRNNPEYIRDFTPWNKVYRRKFFIESKVLFPKGRIYEDIATSPRLYLLAKTFDVNSERSLLWRITTTGSITRSDNLVKITDRLLSVEEIADYLKEQHVDKNILDEYEFSIIDYNLRWIFRDLNKYQANFQDELLSRCVNLLKDVDDGIIKKTVYPISKYARLAKRGKLGKLKKILNRWKVIPNYPIDKTFGLSSKVKNSARYLRTFFESLARALRRRVGKGLSLFVELPLYFIVQPIVRNLRLLDDTVVFSCCWGSAFDSSCGPAQICATLLEKNPSMRCVVFSDSDNLGTISKTVSAMPGKHRIAVVKNHSFSYYRYLWRAKYLINDTGFLAGSHNHYFKKHQGQIAVQTTQGIPLSEADLDADATVASTMKKSSPLKSYKYDYLTSCGAETATIFLGLPGASPKILKTGLAQHDFLFGERSADEIASLKQKYGVSAKKKLILYTPAFRQEQRHTFCTLVNFVSLRQMVGDEYQILFRVPPFNYLHLDMIDYYELSDAANNENNVEPFIKLFGELQSLGLREAGLTRRFNSFDLSALYEKAETQVRFVEANINELALISDMLITGYSSTMFSYAHLGKPMIFFTPDIEFYNETRGGYWNIDEIAPGKVTKSTEELANAILEASDTDIWLKTYEPALEKFKNRFLEWESGNASEKILRELGLID